MDGIEQAADAFSADMGGARSFSSDGGKEVKGAPEPVFGNSDVHDDSEIAGGDQRLPVEAIKEARKELKARNRPDEDKEVDPDEEVDEEEVDPDEEEVDEEEVDGEKAKNKGDEEDEDADPVLNAKYEVQINGEPKEVTVKEALNGYMRRETFHQNMNFIDQGRQAVIARASELVETQKTVEAKLAEAEAILAALIPTPPDWDKEFAADPVKARNLQKTYEGFQAKLNEIKAKRAEAGDTVKEMSGAELRAHVATEARKFAGFTKWGSAKERDKDLASINRTLTEAGFTDEEKGQVYDSRMLKIAWKASKYDRMMANKPKPVSKTRQQEPVTPGAGRNRTAPKGNNRAMDRLRQNGTVESAIPVFASIIARGR